MKTYKNYIFENKTFNQFKTDITEDEIYEYLKIYSKKELEECQVFKGIDFDPISSYPKTLYPSYTILNPKIEKRKSRNTANFYTLMMENLSQWRKFPKRSNSLICTTDYYKARMYGTAYRVIPIDLNAKFGVCPEEDIWESFDVDSVQSFNHLITI